MDLAGKRSKMAGENLQGPSSFVCFFIRPVPLPPAQSSEYLPLCSLVPALLVSVLVSEDMAMVGSIPLLGRLSF